VTLETSKRLEKTRRRFLSKDEKQVLKDKVTADLAMRVPSTPNVYDLVWNYEKFDVYFFSNLRSSNEELESLFKRSFNLSLIRVSHTRLLTFYQDFPTKNGIFYLVYLLHNFPIDWQYENNFKSCWILR